MFFLGKGEREEKEGGGVGVGGGGTKGNKSMVYRWLTDIINILYFPSRVPTKRKKKEKRKNYARKPRYAQRCA